MYTVLSSDLEMVELYKDILPRRIFDAHAHLYTKETVPHAWSESGNFRRKICRIEDYHADMAPFFPQTVEMHMNAIPMPDIAMNDRANGLRDRINTHISREAQAHGGSVGSVYILKDDTADDIEQMASLHGIRAIKCYWFSAGKTIGESCIIKDFLPETAWQIAEKRKIPIILHMMHEKALADERNFSYITAMADRYPEAPLVLAHCARAFASWTGTFSIGKLARYENIWFDMAAVAEPSPMMACIKATAGKRVMWGTDYPICMFRGKPISLGKGFHWFPASSYPSNVAPSLLITESLLALKQAVLLLDLGMPEIEDIFYRNAARLFLKNGVIPLKCM